MNPPDTCRIRRTALAALLSLTLGACGGGDGGNAGANDGGSSKALVRAGQVVTQQGESNALVCVDVQGAGACSANTATAARTSADGSFQISFQAADDAAAQRFLAAALVAELVDGGITYQLSAPAARGDQINPLTTLVQGHVQRTGATLADAEQAVVQQLGIARADIYQYQQQSSTTADNARTVAALTQMGLKLNAPLQIHAAGDAPDTSSRLTSVNFKDAGNYEFYLYDTDGTTSTDGKQFWNASYAGLIAGLPRTLANASSRAEVRNSTAYNGREEYLRSQGNPARVQISSNNQFAQLHTDNQKKVLKDDAVLFEMALTEIDISNWPMADFVREMQADEAAGAMPFEHSLFTLDASLLGTAEFPPGSRLFRKLRTHFVATPATSTGSASTSQSMIGQNNDLPLEAAELSVYGKTLRLQQSINATAWNGMKAALDIR